MFFDHKIIGFGERISKIGPEMADLQLIFFAENLKTILKKDRDRG